MILKTLNPGQKTLITEGMAKVTKLSTKFAHLPIQTDFDTIKIDEEMFKTPGDLI